MTQSYKARVFHGGDVDPIMVYTVIAEHVADAKQEAKEKAAAQWGGAPESYHVDLTPVPLQPRLL